MTTTGTPPHRQPRLVALVALGGAVGTLARWLVSALLPALDHWPAGTLAVNLAGAFCLGLLLARLGTLGPDVGRRRLARLLLGTGVLGSFTTMSTLAVELVLLTTQGRAGLVVAYLAASLVGGAALAWLGLLWGERGGR